MKTEAQCLQEALERNGFGGIDPMKKEAIYEAMREFKSQKEIKTGEDKHNKIVDTLNEAISNLNKMKKSCQNSL